MTGHGDMTAAVIFEATLVAPGRVIPNDPAIEQSVLRGERFFDDVRCTTCHVPALPLDRKGCICEEPTGQPRPCG